VAGALQDQGRAKLLGTRSYGKGSVQTVINLDEGDALKITIARYYTPKNRMIDGKGIDPDILVGKSEFKKLKKPEVKEENGQLSLKAYNEYQKQEALKYLKKGR
jgi:carboxyl-terminal processing protease